jgi:hypothetical protein
MLTPNHDGQWILPTGRNLERTQRALILSRTPVAGKSLWKSRLLGGGKAADGPFPTTAYPWPDETLNWLPEVLLRFGVPAQRRKAAKAQRKHIYVVMMGLEMTGKSATGKCSCHPSSCQPLAPSRPRFPDGLPPAIG